MDLPLCFALIAALAIALYVLADGFDLGVGVLFLVAPRDEERDIMMESIAPLWDGNETWLVFGASVLLAAFPIGYAVLLPAFYLPIMLMLFALIFRGVAFGFRFQAGRSRRFWDIAFAAGSALAAFCQGLILGGFISGPVVENGVFAGGPFSFVTVLGVLCGVGLVAGYALLGAGWLIWRTQGATQTFGREVGHAALLLTAAMMTLVSVWTALSEPEIAGRWFSWPGGACLAALPATSIIVCALLWRSLWGRRDARPFALAVVLFFLGFIGLAASLWPYVVPRRVTIWDGASDPATLKFVGVGVAAILPVILAYLGRAYYVFRGKTVASKTYGADTAPEAAMNCRRVSSMDANLHLS